MITMTRKRVMNVLRTAADITKGEDGIAALDGMLLWSDGERVRLAASNGVVWFSVSEDLHFTPPEHTGAPTTLHVKDPEDLLYTLNGYSCEHVRVEASHTGEMRITSDQACVTVELPFYRYGEPRIPDPVGTARLELDAKWFRKAYQMVVKAHKANRPYGRKTHHIAFHEHWMVATDGQRLHRALISEEEVGSMEDVLVTTTIEQLKEVMRHLPRAGKIPFVVDRESNHIRIGDFVLRVNSEKFFNYTLVIPAVFAGTEWAQADDLRKTALRTKEDTMDYRLSDQCVYHLTTRFIKDLPNIPLEASVPEPNPPHMSRDQLNALHLQGDRFEAVVMPRRRN